MMEWVLHRMYLPTGTLGVMECAAVRSIFWTLEDLPGDGPNHCVPEGVYNLEPHSGTRYKNHWALVNRELNVLHWEEADVEGERSTVLVHNGSLVTHTEGCVLIGHMAKLDDLMIYNSRIALDAFHSVMRAYPDLRTLRIQRG